MKIPYGGTRQISLLGYTWAKMMAVTNGPSVPIDEDPLQFEYRGPALRNNPNAGEEYRETHLHHSDPIFMGGESKQPLTRMPREEHCRLHQLMNEFLRLQEDEFGQHMRPQSNNSGAEIRQNFTRPERLDALRRFYNQNYNQFPDAARDFFQQHPALNECECEKTK